MKPTATEVIIDHAFEMLTVAKTAENPRYWSGNFEGMISALMIAGELDSNDVSWWYSRAEDMYPTAQ